MKVFNERYIDNGMLDFLLKEREAGRIRHLGWSFHGDVEVFDQVLAMHDTVKWDFVQIQLNYMDWRHATGNNVNAEYLYGELAKRNIAAVIMEPLLGGRLSNVPEHIGFPLCRFTGTGTDCIERYDLHGALARQHPYLFTTGSSDR